MYQRKKKHDERWLVVQMEKREKKTSEPEIIKILYTRATVTVYISTVTVARGKIYMIIQDFGSTDVEQFCFRMCKNGSFFYYT